MNKKAWIIIVVLIGVIALLISWLAGIRNAASDRDAHISVLRGDVNRYKTEAGTWLSELNGMERAYDDVYAELKAAKAELEKKGVKTSDLKSIGKIRLYVHDTVRLEPIIITEDSIVYDTIIGEFSYQDEWADIEITKHMWWWDLDYTVRDSIYFLVNEIKKPFRSNVLGVQAVASNPHVNITGLEYFEITPKQKRWGIGPQVGVGFNGEKFSPYIGLGLQYDLIRF